MARASCAAVVSCFSFFLQAEDGIRDSSVTGVQTCALPICGNRGSVSDMDRRTFLKRSAAVGLLPLFPQTLFSGSVSRRLRPRSEERRVGKSVDLGGRRIIKKKKKTRRGSAQHHEKLDSQSF